jgi:hypothetical protein
MCLLIQHHLPTLSVQYISLLFGIDLAGAKVIMDPVVSEEVSYEENELENAGVFLHDDGVEHYENLGVLPVTTHLHQPKYSPIKGKYCLTLKVKCNDFEYLIVLLYQKKIHK